MTEFCQEHGIIHEVTASYTPQSNGVAERKNRTLMDMGNCMILSSGAPKNLRDKLSFSPASYSIGFPNETLTSLCMNVGKGELLIFNSIENPLNPMDEFSFERARGIDAESKAKSLKFVFNVITTDPNDLTTIRKKKQFDFFLFDPLKGIYTM